MSLITTKDLERSGVDGDEIKYDDGSDLADVIKNKEETEVNTVDPRIEEERQKFIDSIEEEIKSMAGNMNVTAIRSLSVMLNNYLYHEASNFSELIERN